MVEQHMDFEHWGECGHTFFATKVHFLQSKLTTPSRVARWYIFTPKIHIWVHFVGSCIEYVGIFYVHLVNYTDIWYILLLFCIFIPVLVCSQENSGNPDSKQRCKKKKNCWKNPEFCYRQLANTDRVCVNSEVIKIIMINTIEASFYEEW
jgi:hypothetical protein